MQIFAGEPLSRTRVSAPVRVADVGGWTDTWFGGPGRVCSIAVEPGVQVTASTYAPDAPRLDAAPGAALHDPPSAAGGAPIQGSITVRSSSLSAPVRCVVQDGRWSVIEPVLDPLLAQAVLAIGESAPAWSGHAVLDIDSKVPVGASVGTSATVLVALLAAMDTVVADGALAAADLARLGHEVETQRVGREAGVQDQWAAAMGGVGLLHIDDFPHARHEAVPVSDQTLAELGDRLLTVAFGPHDSSAIHRQVIRAVVGDDQSIAARPRAALARLADLASQAAATVARGDLDAYGAVLLEATRAQESLHADLLGPAHRRAIEVASRSGAAAWKVNGAGGDGGSLTVLAQPGRAEAVRAALGQVTSEWAVLDLRPSPAGVTRLS